MQTMTPLSDTGIKQFRANLINKMIDDMDTDTSIQIVYDSLEEYYERLDEEDIKAEIIDTYGEETLKDLYPVDAQRSLYDEIVDYYSDPLSYA